jgi:hypothetical protein
LLESRELVDFGVAWLEERLGRERGDTGRA